VSARAAIERWLGQVWIGRRPLASLLLWPLSLGWWIGSALHRAAYGIGLRSTVRAGVPVIAVGNLTVGGAGKTPVTLALATRLIADGRKVAVVSRGYGRRSRGVVIVADGQAVRATADDGGDEPLWLARREPRLIVVVGERRAEAAATAMDLGADLVILDDGLSHYGLAHTVEVVVIDDGRRLGNGRLLPAGPLRLAPAAAARADLIWWTGVSADAVRVPVPEALRSHPAVHSSYAATGLVDFELRRREPIEALKGRRILAVCGIARPEAFEATLAALGANVRDLAAFPDHHRFSRGDVERIDRLARSKSCDLIVTTEKDAMRLGLVTEAGDWYRALAMDVVIKDTAFDLFARRFSPGLPSEAA
jgi:tetraacyldisaccharide 4'-kinase